MKKYSFDTVIFDLDGVVTNTAKVHAAAWKVMFDEYLRQREQRDGEGFQEFTYKGDYLTYVDGKPRYKGVESFLKSRNIDIAFGDVEDDPQKETVCALGNRKNIKFREVLESEGVEIFDSTVDFMKDLKAKGVRIGVASSSKNCQFVLQATGLEDLFETRVDGVVSAELGLKGKPEGDIFVRATENLEGTPARAAIVEDAVSGVQAGQNGGFGLVIGIAREKNEAALAANGADIVVTDFAGVTTETVEQWFKDKT